MSRTMPLRILLSLILLTALAACGSEDSAPSTAGDATVDATDTATDASSTDASDTSTPDTADDAGDDADPTDVDPGDAAEDAEPDSATDTAPDVEPDAGADTTSDAGVDVEPDVAEDTTPDAVEDAGSDADPDVALPCTWDDPASCGEGAWCDVPDGQCSDNPIQGVCAERPMGCPRIYDPVCGCDGETYSNGCIADAAGVNIASPGECPTADGCRSDRECGPGSFCRFESGACAAPGVCEARPRGCPEIYAPVCGCDGRTYGNECEASAAGVSVAATGECGVTEGCRSSGECDRGQYCMFESGACAAPGVCEARPRGCDDVFAPVCGCDGRTYGNACEAAAAGVSIESTGACRDAGGCNNNSECPLSSYCAFAPATCEAPGECSPRPEGCPAIYDPVCGCDGRTYSNGCVAASSGASVASRGECP